MAPQMNDDTDWLTPELKAEFRDRLIADQGAAANAWALMARPATRAAAVEELSTIAHKLAGLGSAFGCPDVTAAGRELETALASCSFDTAGDPPPQLSDVFSRFQRTLDAGINPD